MITFQKLVTRRARDNYISFCLRQWNLSESDSMQTLTYIEVFLTGYFMVCH